MKRKGTVSKSPKGRRKWLAIMTSSAMALLAVLCIGGGTLIWTTLGQIKFIGTEASWPEVSLSPEEEEEYQLSEDLFDDSVYENAKTVAEIPVKGNGNGITNIMLLGIDGNSYTSRSDVNMILSINDNTKTIKLVSLLRDTYVSLPGRDKNGDGRDDWNKLNAAYRFGGFSLQSAMLEQNFRLKIDQFIAVNFEAFPKVVDIMGGVDIELTKAELSQVPKAGVKAEPGAPNFASLSYLGKAGTYHLDGYQALQYARIRHLDNDFKRTQRQRIVVEQLMEKAKTMSFAGLTGVVTSVLPHIYTNMSTDELMSYAASSLKYKNYSIEIQYHVPQPKQYAYKTINASDFVVLTDPKASVTALHQYMYDA